MVGQGKKAVTFAAALWKTSAFALDLLKKMERWGNGTRWDIFGELKNKSI